MERSRKTSRPVSVALAVFFTAAAGLASAQPVSGPPEVEPGVSAHPIAPIVNIVSNPSFEQVDPAHPDRPAGFTPGVVPAPGRAPKMSWEEPGHTGARSIAIECFHSDDLGYWETTVPVEPEMEYAISFYYRCASLGRRPATRGDPEYSRGGAGGPNLELGIVPDEPGSLSKPTDWSDIGLALGPVGGAYLPVATDWALFRQTVRTVPGQIRMRVKLRLYGYAQKVWFDDLSVVKISTAPLVRVVSPREGAEMEDRIARFQWECTASPESYVLECSATPMFCRGSTRRVLTLDKSVSMPLADGRWFWHIGIPDRDGIPFWLADGSFDVGPQTWIVSDTTPPHLHSPRPLPNDNAAPDAEIVVKISETGSGVDVSSTTIILDGRDVREHARTTADQVRLRLPSPLAKGPHQAEVSIADRCGNRSNRFLWQFGVGEYLTNKLRIVGTTAQLNGRPYFPVGIYSYQCHPADGRFNEAMLQQAAEAGFDVVLDTIPPGLDAFHKCGMMGLVNLTPDMKRIEHPGTLESATISLLEGRAGLGRFRNHPAALGIWADDPENLDDTAGTPLPESTRARLDLTRRVIKEHCPDLPIVFAISNLPRLEASASYADVILTYRYPVPHMPPQMIYGWTLAYATSVVRDKPIWFNSQACDVGYSTSFGSTAIRPIPAEIRAMAYYSLVLGVRGWTAYAAQTISEESPPGYWRELLRLATEIRHLAPALAAGEPAVTMSLADDCCAGSMYFREIQHDGTHTAIAVNMSAGRVLAKWIFDRPVRVAALFEDRVMATPSSAVNDVFEPFGVHIYCWR